MGDLWGGLLRLIGSSLSFFYDMVSVYGLSIIFLTIAISVLLFPLTLKQTRSMKAMQEIQPEVKRLQKEYKSDRETLNQELMALYKERGVNPAAGCLPMLVQLPIWFALFRVLRDPFGFVPEGSKLQAALAPDSADPVGRFLGMDLRLEPSSAMTDGIVAAIPYIIAILVVVATAYYQQRQTMVRSRNSGQEVNPQQQSMQTVMKIFPLFFGFISWTLPAGLVLYFAVSQIFRIGQQAVILRLDAERQAAAADPGKASGASTPPAPSGDGDQGKGSKSGNGGTSSTRPSVHSSKKRKRRRRK